MKYYLYRLMMAGECLYVGQTRNPKRRMRQHKSSKVRNLMGVTMEILRECDFENVFRLEAQITKAYRMRGEARLNGTLETYEDKEKRIAFQMPSVAELVGAHWLSRKWV